MTEELFRDDAYLKSCEATVTKVDDQGIRLDRTVFYPMGGGQPGDAGADNDKVKTGCRPGSLLVNFHEWMTRRPQPQRPDMTGWGRIGF